MNEIKVGMRVRIKDKEGLCLCSADRDCDFTYEVIKLWGESFCDIKRFGKSAIYLYKKRLEEVGMTGVEALQALMEGKKVKRMGWDDGFYIRLRVNPILDCNCFEDQTGETINIDGCLFTYDDWKLYQEEKIKVSIEEAIEIFSKGESLYDFCGLEVKPVENGFRLMVGNEISQFSPIAIIINNPLYKKL